MSRKFVTVVIVSLIAVLVAVLVVMQMNTREATAPAPDANRTPNTTNEAVDGEDVITETAEIIFTDSGFEPQELTVITGTEVTVRNESSNRVQFSSDEHPTHRLNPEMNLRTLSPGESASYIATEVGEWGFHDHINASLTGMITVTQ